VPNIFTRFKPNLVFLASFSEKFPVSYFLYIRPVGEALCMKTEGQSEVRTGMGKVMGTSRSNAKSA
jgi:hypothetical protein